VLRKRLRAILGLGLIWGLGWGLGGGFVMEAFVDPHGRIADMWPQGLAMSGFFGGVIFSLMLWATEGRRRFDELSLTRVGLWGAIAGLLLVLSGGLIGMSASVMLTLVGPIVTLSAASAAASLAVARFATKRQLSGMSNRYREIE
jgi:hypothetical protein